MLSNYPIKFFTSTGAKPIANNIFKELHVRLRNANCEAEFGGCPVTIFSNKNLEAQVDEVRDRTVVLLHTQSSNADHDVIELLAMLSAITKAQPKRVILVFPYMTWSRSDRKDKPRISVLGKDLARIINEIYGIRDVLLIEPHDAHLKHYYTPDADEIPLIWLPLAYVKETLLIGENLEDWRVVYADAGATKRFEQVPSIMQMGDAHIQKARVKEQLRIVGINGDVKGKNCILVDDEVGTTTTAELDAEALKTQYGAKKVIGVMPHAVLMAKGKSTRQLMSEIANGPIDQFIVSDTIPVAHKAKLCPDKITIISADKWIGEAIKRMILGQSLSAFHKFKGVEL